MWSRYFLQNLDPVYRLHGLNVTGVFTFEVAHFSCTRVTGTMYNGLTKGFVLNTVEPPNKGHFESEPIVLYSEAVLWWEVQIIIESTIIISIGAIASVL